MEPTNYANYEYDEYRMIINIKPDVVPIDLKECAVTHVSHPQDYSVKPHIRRRRPRWHNSKKRKR